MSPLDNNVKSLNKQILPLETPNTFPVAAQIHAVGLVDFPPKY
jgi:hypothetical protein